jgi:hypothetical protein
MCSFAVAVLVQLDLKQRPTFESDYDIIYPHLPKPLQHLAQQYSIEDFEVVDDDSSDDISTTCLAAAIPQLPNRAPRTAANSSREDSSFTASSFESNFEGNSLESLSNEVDSEVRFSNVAMGEVFHLQTHYLDPSCISYSQILCICNSLMKILLLV